MSFLLFSKNFVLIVRPLLLLLFRLSIRKKNGIFVLGVGFFFFRQNSTFLLAVFDGIFSISFEKFSCPELKCEKIFHL